MLEAQAEPPDEELVSKIRSKKVDSAAAERAFIAFYDRHVQFVWRCVRNADKQLTGYGLGVDDIVEETFFRVWSGGADSFSPISNLAPESACLRVRRWLATIARNLVKDKLRSRDHVLPFDPTGENEELFSTGTACGAATPHLQLLQLVTSCLSERDAAIVWFKIGYYNPETRQSQPPPDMLDSFCKEWNIEPPALRQAYDRALVTLREAMLTST